MRPAPSEIVFHWLAEQEPLSLYTTSITKAEILAGIERLPTGKRKRGLAAAAHQTFEIDFMGRVLSFDSTSAAEYAKIVVARAAIGWPIPQMDGLIAAIARQNHATLVTRNEADFDHCGIKILDPWRSRP
jgi:predicted nucleic acid-binding protein